MTLAALAYFDTSVVVKRYVREPGSPAALRLLRRYGLLSSALTPVELLSAVHRRHTAGDISDEQCRGILRDVRHDRLQWQLIEVNQRVLSRAEEVLQATQIRTLDAVHIAAAQCFETASGTRVTFITADRRQRLAAEHVGLDVSWVD